MSKNFGFLHRAAPAATAVALAAAAFGLPALAQAAAETRVDFVFVDDKAVPAQLTGTIELECIGVRSIKWNGPVGQGSNRITPIGSFSCPDFGGVMVKSEVRSSTGQQTSCLPATFEVPENPIQVRVSYKELTTSGGFLDCTMQTDRPAP